MWRLQRAQSAVLVQCRSSMRHAVEAAPWRMETPKGLECSAAMLPKWHAPHCRSGMCCAAKAALQHVETPMNSERCDAAVPKWRAPRCRRGAIARGDSKGLRALHCCAAEVACTMLPKQHMPAAEAECASRAALPRPVSQRVNALAVHATPVLSSVDLFLSYRSLFTFPNKTALVTHLVSEKLA